MELKLFVCLTTRSARRRAGGSTLPGGWRVERSDMLALPMPAAALANDDDDTNDMTLDDLGLAPLFDDDALANGDQVRSPCTAHRAERERLLAFAHVEDGLAARRHEALEAPHVPRRRRIVLRRQQVAVVVRVGVVWPHEQQRAAAQCEG